MRRGIRDPAWLAAVTRRAVLPPAGYASWWDARDLVLADGDFVMSMADKGADARHLAAFSASRRPAYRATGGPFGEPAVDFNSSESGFLVSPSFTAETQAITLGMIFRSDGAKSGARLFGGPTSGARIEVFDDASRLCVYRGATLQNTFISFGVWSYFVATLPATTSPAFLNQNGFTVTGPVGVLEPTQWRVGNSRLVSVGQNWNGRWSECLIYRGVDAAAASAPLEAYFRARLRLP